MLSVVWKILSILGILVLILLAALLVTVLLVLFLPVTYRGDGSVHQGEYRMLFRFRWLLGLVRGRFTYDGSSELKIKALWLTLYDSGKRQDSGTKRKKVKKQKEVDRKTKEDIAKEDIIKEEKTYQEIIKQDKIKEYKAGQRNSGEETAAPENSETLSSAESEGNADSADQGPPSEECQSGEQISAAKESSSDRLANLKEKLQSVLAIVLDEDNQGLTGHALNRLGRILSSIHPRSLHLEALIGTGEPDTTGYLYGAFWALRPFLSRRSRIVITPDFERQILEGEVSLRGHIMAAVLLHHIVRVILDRRLRRLIDQLKGIQNSGKTDTN